MKQYLQCMLCLLNYNFSMSYSGSIILRIKKWEIVILYINTSSVVEASWDMLYVEKYSKVMS